MSFPLVRDAVLYIDCTSTFRSALKTGVQRVVRALLAESAVFENTLGLECIPIAYQFNRFYRLEDAECVSLENQGEFTPISFNYRDVYLCPDAFWTMGMDAWYDYLVDCGVTIATVIYDLIPIVHPKYCSIEARIGFESALSKVVRKSQLLFCISDATRRDLISFCGAQGIEITDENCRVTPLAPALKPSEISLGSSLSRLPDCPFFLMVGSIEPRRGYLETLTEFERYRRNGGDASLLIVGKEGGAAESIVRQIRAAGPAVLWLGDVDDDELICAYRRALAVVCASHAEGYGMSVSEGLAYNGLVLANRLPVFGEFAGSSPYYFEIDRNGDLARLMGMASGLVRIKNPIDLGSWSRTAKMIAEGLADISLAHGRLRAIEVNRNSPEAVRWAYWLYLGRPCSPEDLCGWMRFPTVAEMFQAMGYESRRCDTPLTADAVRWAQAILNGRTEVSEEEVERWCSICANLLELRAHLMYEHWQLEAPLTADAVRWLQLAINGRNGVGDDEVKYWQQRCNSVLALREVLLRESAMPRAPE